MIDRYGPAPYAPASSVLDVIRAKRKNRNLRFFDSDALEKLGIRESLVPRTAQALRLLDLLTDDGFVTPTFEEVISAPSGELQRSLEKLIRRAYKPIFEELDPTVASTSALEEAFAYFQPPGQRSRMVSMFQGLMKAAHMTPTEESAVARGAAEFISASGAFPQDAVTSRAVTSRAVTSRAAASRAATSRAAANQAAASRAAASNSALSKAAAEAALRSVKEMEPHRSVRWTSEASEPAASHSSRAQHSLKLDSGGSIDITLDVNLFSLSKADRDFVMDLIDRVSGYGANTAHTRQPLAPRRE